MKLKKRLKDHDETKKAKKQLKLWSDKTKTKSIKRLNSKKNMSGVKASMVAKLKVKTMVCVYTKGSTVAKLKLN